MTEEVDLKLTAVWNAMEEGLAILNKEEEDHKHCRAEIERKEKLEKEIIYECFPKFLSPFAHVLEVEKNHIIGAVTQYFGWSEIVVPDFAKIIVLTEKLASEFDNTYFICDPDLRDPVDGNGQLVEDFKDLTRGIPTSDHRIALARAYRIMKIHKESIQVKVNDQSYENILKKISIEEVIENNYGWKLEQHNKFLIALNDRSLIVDPVLQIYYWNSNGETGDVIGWIIKREKLSTRDAISYLVDLYKDRFVTTIPEPQYVPLEEEMANSDSEFDSPLVAFLSNYTMNELVNFIDSRIDLRFSQIKN